jgi:hypothetical protein
MARKRKTLPDDFEAMLKRGDPAELRAVFDGCAIDARGGPGKWTALAFPDCPDDLARWLVENGADLAAEDRYGETPLHLRAGSVRGLIAGLLALGADVRHGEGQPRGTPLHRAAGACIPDNVRILVAAGAPVDARDREGLTPLERALRYGSNVKIERLAPVAEMLLAAGARRSSRMAEWVRRIGTEFEFHREGFAPELRESTSSALDRLYVLFEVPPVPRRTMHEGMSPILVPDGPWEDRFQALWDSLVPSSGAAATVQGEVVRIAGRIARELDGNGGVNWDAAYRAMAEAWLAHVGTGTPLPADGLAEAARIVAEAKRRSGDPRRLCALAVDWVRLNPQPMPLAPPAYDR